MEIFAFPMMHYECMYKSLLQEQCRKIGLSDPTYVVARDVVGNVATYVANVSVNGVFYSSEPGMLQAKCAEQSAAKVALTQLFIILGKKMDISQLMLETGLCKSMLQDYAIRMGFSYPMYDCQVQRVEGRMPTFVCIVSCGGITYGGRSARTKKKAMKNAGMSACAQIMVNHATAALNAVEQRNVHRDCQ